MKPDFIGLATQTWKQMRCFPSSNALADAVLLSAIYGLVVTPFSFQRYFPLQKDKWNGLFFSLKLLLTPLSLFWHFNLSRRLRRNEKKAWRTATIHSSANLFLLANSMYWCLRLRNGLRDLTEEDHKNMTAEQIASYQATQAK